MGTDPGSDPLEALRALLLSDSMPVVAGQEGLNFQAHKLLTTLIHRAAGLHAHHKPSDTEGWTRYIVDFFPPGQNGAEDARLLFKDWRCTLLKDGSVGPGVAILHGQSWSHWRRSDGVLMINLESMWADYEYSVERFIEFLRVTPERSALALQRHAGNATQTRVLAFVGPDGPTGASATVRGEPGAE